VQKKKASGNGIFYNKTLENRLMQTVEFPLLETLPTNISFITFYNPKISNSNCYITPWGSKKEKYSTKI